MAKVGWGLDWDDVEGGQDYFSCITREVLSLLHGGRLAQTTLRWLLAKGTMMELAI